jgi:hypothetical protein
MLWEIRAWKKYNEIKSLAQRDLLEAVAVYWPRQTSNGEVLHIALMSRDSPETSKEIYPPQTRRARNPLLKRKLTYQHQSRQSTRKQAPLNISEFST